MGVKDVLKGIALAAGAAAAMAEIFDPNKQAVAQSDKPSEREATSTQEIRISESSKY